MTDKPRKSNRPKKKPTGDYPNGYCRPREDVKWKPGESGNPSGRPKKLPDPDETFMKQALRLNNVKIGDEIEKMTNYEIASLSLFRKAASGHPKAIELAFKRYEKAHRELSMRAAQKPKEEFSWAEEQEELFQQLEKMLGVTEKQDEDDDLDK